MIDGGTSLCADLDSPHRAGENLVWCASLPLAWRELCAAAKGPVRLAPDAPAAARDVADALNRAASEEIDAGDAPVLARAGIGTPSFMERLLADLRERFGELAPSEVPAPPAPDALVVYARLAAAALFATPFARASFPFYFRGSFVHSFGLWLEAGDDRALWERRRSQVLVHHPCLTDEEADALPQEEYDRLSEEFVVELAPADARFRVIVARIEPGATLRETVGAALARVGDRTASHPKGRLDGSERLEVPILDLAATESLEALQGVTIENEGLPSRQIGEVVQDVRFRLDEGGAQLVSSALVYGLCLPPRHLTCNDRFAVLLLARGAKDPFFALWVENTSFMEAAPDPTRRR